MGGRLVLAKIVLKSIPIYWFSLGMVMVSIASDIRKKDFLVLFGLEIWIRVSFT